MLNRVIAHNCASFSNSTSSHHRSAAYSPAATPALLGKTPIGVPSRWLERPAPESLGKPSLFTIISAPMARFITHLSKRSDDAVQEHNSPPNGEHSTARRA